jgi:hypothetical protein
MPPQPKTKTAAVETEKGFGTGLRAQLKRRRGEPDEVQAVAAETVEVEGTEPVEAELDVCDPEHLQAELVASYDREDALRVALADQAEAYERAVTELTTELEERERRVADQLEWIRAETSRLATVSAELEAENRVADAPQPGESARDYLRRRLEAEGERVWQAFESALDATRPDGTPDYRTRLAAATALLAEAYSTGDAPRAPVLPAEGEEPKSDELALLRATKARKPATT